MTNKREFDNRVPQKVGNFSEKAQSAQGYLSPPCRTSHPMLKLGKAELRGSSCHSPIVMDSDVYVGLDHTMEQTIRRFPWESGDQVHYPITDLHAPKNPELFGKMVEWLSDQIVLGRSVHVGCFGGHGRTGLLLAALISNLWMNYESDQGALKVDPLLEAELEAFKFMADLPDQDLLKDHDFIGWLRKNYCKKAVESHEQIKFLMDHYGAKKVAPIKGFEGPKPVTNNGKHKGTVEGLDDVTPENTKQLVQDFISDVSKEVKAITGKVALAPSDWKKTYEQPYGQPYGQHIPIKVIRPVFSKKSVWGTKY